MWVGVWYIGNRHRTEVLKPQPLSIQKPQCVSYFNAGPLGMYWAAKVSLGYSLQIYLRLTLHCFFVPSRYSSSAVRQVRKYNQLKGLRNGIQYLRSRIRKYIEVRNSHSTDSLDKLNFHYHPSPKPTLSIPLLVQPS